MLLVSTVTTDAPRVDPEERVKLIPVGAGITRVVLYFGFMEHPNACWLNETASKPLVGYLKISREN